MTLRLTRLSQLPVARLPEPGLIHGNCLCDDSRRLKTLITRARAPQECDKSSTAPGSAAATGRTELPRGRDSTGPSPRTPGFVRDPTRTGPGLPRTPATDSCVPTKGKTGRTLVRGAYRWTCGSAPTDLCIRKIYDEVYDLSRRLKG